MLKIKLDNIKDLTERKKCEAWLDKFNFLAGDKRLTYREFISCEAPAVIWADVLQELYEVDRISDIDTVTDVQVPEGVLHLPDSFLINLENLYAVELPSTLTTIGGGAFNFCSLLEEIDIPDSVVSVGNGFLYYCESLELTHLKRGNSLLTYYRNVLLDVEYVSQASSGSPDVIEGDPLEKRADGYTYLTLPQEITVLSGDSFAVGTYSLAGTDLRKLGWNALELHEGIRHIPNRCFADCTNIEKIVLLSDQTTRDKDWYAGCPNLCTVVISGRDMELAK